MATDFIKNQISLAGSFKPTVHNMPLDIRTRIATYRNYDTIPKPFVGMLVYVEDEDSYYEVESIIQKQDDNGDYIKDENGREVHKIHSMKNIVLNDVLEPIKATDVDKTLRLKKETDEILNKIVNRINAAGNIINGIKFAKFGLSSNNSDKLYIEGVIGVQHPIGAEVKCEIGINENNLFTLIVEQNNSVINEPLHSIFECRELLASKPSDLTSVECTVRVTIDGKEYIRLVLL